MVLDFFFQYNKPVWFDLATFSHETLNWFFQAPSLGMHAAELVYWCRHYEDGYEKLLHCASDEGCCQFPFHVYTLVIFKFTNNEQGIWEKNILKK